MEQIRLLQCSMQFSDSLKQIDHDAEQALEYAARRDIAIIGFSEAVVDSQVYRALARACRRHDYWFQDEIRGDVRFGVHPDYRIKESGYLDVVPADHRKASQGGHAARGIAEVTVKTPGGNIVTDHSAHWLTGFDLDRRPGHENQRERQFDEQTDTMIERVKLHGKGRRISFWQGDTNMDEQADTGFDHQAIHYQFNKAGLESIYDELYKPGKPLPNTHEGRTIDIIGSYRPDARVSAVDVRVVPRRGRNVDHLMVEATYGITGSGG